MLDTHIYTSLPEDEIRPAPKANEKFRKMVHAYAGRPKLPLLSRDEERELIGLVQDAGCQEAMNRLVEAYMGFIVNIANEFASKSGLTEFTDDLYSEGCEAFMKSVRKFKLRQHKTRLSSLAKHYVTGACFNFVKNNKFPFRYGTNLPEKRAFFSMGRLRAQFFEIHGRNMRDTPEDAEAASSFSGIPAATIWRTIQVQKAAVPFSVSDIQIHDNQAHHRAEETLLRDSARACLGQHVNKVADTLIERDRDILLTVISDPEKRTALLEICARRHGISIERVRQIYRGALKEIRASLAEKGLNSIADVA